jgi:hypothetical protein
VYAFVINKRDAIIKSKETFILKEGKLNMYAGYINN